MMRTLNSPCFCFPQPPPAQSMVQALELLYALGGENIILCFTYNFLMGVVEKSYLDLVIGWALIISQTRF